MQIWNDYLEASRTNTIMNPFLETSLECTTNEWLQQADGSWLLHASFHDRTGVERLPSTREDRSCKFYSMHSSQNNINKRIMFIYVWYSSLHQRLHFVLISYDSCFVVFQRKYDNGSRNSEKEGFGSMVLPLLPTYTKEVPVTGSKTWTKGS